MLNSVTDDRPIASTWLDRLRLSKGISTTDDEDASGTPLSLDDFLRRNNHTEDVATTSSDSPPSAPTPSDPELDDSPSEPASGEWYDALSELFNFGESSSSRSNTKKVPRKQLNPRHCSVEAPLRNQKRDSSLVLPKFARNKNLDPSVVEEVEDGVDEEEEGEMDLVGFSRSEVTVIDTSFKIWKSEKLVFRRRNVWKVREKKGKSKVGSLKKKMMKKKKMKKKKNKKTRECDVGDGKSNGKWKRRKISHNNAQYHIEKLHDDALENSNVNRILLSRLPSKPRKEGSFTLHASKKSSEREAL